MSKYPFWPAQIANPPTVDEEAAEGLPKKKPSASKKGQHYVYFFGTKNFAWISDEKIVPHSEEMLNKVPKKKSASYSKAICEIIEISTPLPTSVKEDSVQDELTNHFSAVQTQSTTTHLQKRGRKRKRKISCTKTNKKRNWAEGASDLELSPMEKTACMSSDTELSELEKMFRGIPNVELIEESVYENGDSPPYLYEPTVAVQEYSELPLVPSVDFSRPPNPTMIKRNIDLFPGKIGFIGLGMMGQRIVKNMLDSGHNVSVWNRTPEKCKQFVDIGVEQFLTPAELVLNCDIIFCCVSESQAVKSLMFQVDGILQGFKNSEPRKKGYVEMTSIDSYTSQVIAEAIIENGGIYLEAALVGSISLAEKSSLLVLSAGHHDLFVECLSCLYAVCESPYYFGCDVGEGSYMNLVHGMLTSGAYVILAETMSLVERLNLSKKGFLEILKYKKISCPLYVGKCQAIVTNNFSTDTSLKCQQQLLNMALALGSTHTQPLELSSTASQLYKECKLSPYSEHDASAVYLGAKC
ncbi:putative oxidoreductase GLYR1 homolog [Trichonephila clavata]|uniref:Cytokine-like nuclear factor N-PAC n=1 Tax=Trichonephila clavata TaxID=2740835 RepID=A0A8X6I214_TRICU|nr:putative oxidoreductase GLYR1 homolog [Trichonephila clavata]